MNGIGDLFLQCSTSGFAPLTITVRAIKQALCSACQLSSPEYACAQYIDHSIESLKSGVTSRAASGLCVCVCNGEDKKFVQWQCVAMKR